MNCIQKYCLSCFLCCIFIESHKNKRSEMEITQNANIEKLKSMDHSKIPLFSFENKIVIARIIDVYDGDTCKIILLQDGKFVRYTCRLLGIDTPEMKPLRNKPNREEEIKNAIKCRNRLLQLTSSCEIGIDDNKTKIQIKTDSLQNMFFSFQG